MDFQLSISASPAGRRSFLSVCNEKKKHEEKKGKKQEVTLAVSAFESREIDWTEVHEFQGTNLTKLRGINWLLDLQWSQFLLYENFKKII